MTDSTDLMDRARRLLGSTATATLALAPLAMQPAQAFVLDIGDLSVNASGAYFYNASGYFSDWRGRPDGAGLSATNSDGSLKLYGDATASPGQFLGHHCHTDPYPDCGYYQDRGITLVWSGQLNRPAVAGDRLAISVDFNVSIPDVGGQWVFGARLMDADPGNVSGLPTYGEASDTGWISAPGTYRVQGDLLTSALEEWQIQPDQPVYWQVFVAGVANAPWDESAYSPLYNQYITPFRTVTLSVPQHSIDLAHVDAGFMPTGPLGLSVSAVPEPGTWLLMALGLGAVALRRARP